MPYNTKGRINRKERCEKAFEELMEKESVIHQGSFTRKPQAVMEHKIVLGYQLVKNIGKITKALGYSASEVREVLHKAGIKKYVFTHAHNFANDYFKKEEFSKMWNSGKYKKYQLAEHFKLSVPTIKRISKELGLKSLHNLDIIQERDKRIRKLYHKGHSTMGIGELLKLNDETIRQRLKKMNVEMRSSNYKNVLYNYNLSSKKKWITPTKLRNYIKAEYPKKSIIQISRDLRIDRGTVKRRLEAMGIKIRKQKIFPYNPKPCAFCGTIIERPYNQGNPVREQKYCSQSCKSFMKDYKLNKPHAVKRYNEMHNKEEDSNE